MSQNSTSISASLKIAMILALGCCSCCCATHAPTSLTRDGKSKGKLPSSQIVGSILEDVISLTSYKLKPDEALKDRLDKHQKDRLDDLQGRPAVLSMYLVPKDLWWAYYEGESDFAAVVLVTIGAKGGAEQHAYCLSDINGDWKIRHRSFAGAH